LSFFLLLNNVRYCFMIARTAPQQILAHSWAISWRLY
jgi:hypothetical protein